MKYMKDLQNELAIYLSYKVIHDVNKGENFLEIDKKSSKFSFGGGLRSNERRRRIVSACNQSFLNADLAHGMIVEESTELNNMNSEVQLRA